MAAVVKELGRRGDALGLLAQKEAAVHAQMDKLPPKGPKRADALLALDVVTAESVRQILEASLR